MNGTRLLSGELRSLIIVIHNAVLNALPDTWMSGRLLRPCLARLMGMKCGKGVTLRRGIYYGNLRNISLGKGTGVNREVFFDAFETITIGDNVGVGFRTVFVTSTHAIGDGKGRVGELLGGPIVVEDGVWIGAGATIGPGVTLGEGCVVSAGSVVLRSVPSHVVVVGSPARVVKHLTADNNEDGLQGE